MADGTYRKARCTVADARIRLDHARRYLLVAETVLSAEAGGDATVATGNAVLAAIAAADAICCAATGSRFRGRDHAGVADYVEQVTGDKKLAALLRDIVSLKDIGHYGIENVVVTRARSAVRKAAQVVEEAERRVR